MYIELTDYYTQRPILINLRKFRKLQSNGTNAILYLGSSDAVVVNESYKTVAAKIKEMQPGPLVLKI